MAGIADLWRRLTRRAVVPGLVGVEFSPEGVSLAHVSRQGEDAPRLHACDHAEAADLAFQTTELTRMVAEHGLASMPCVVALQPGDCKLLQVEAPEVEADELKAAIQWRISDLIEFPIEETIFDVFPLPSSKQPGRPALVCVAVVHKPRVDAIAECVAQSGLELQAIDISELALRNIATLLPEDSKGAAMLYLTRHGGLMTLTAGQQLYLARSLDSNTSTLESLLGSVPDESDTGIQLTQEQSDADKMVLELQRSLDYYESYFAQPPVSSLVVAPTGADVTKLTHFITNNLGTLSRSLDLNAVFDCFEVITDTLQAQCLCAVGAALREEREAAQ